MHIIRVECHDSIDISFPLTDSYNPFSASIANYTLIAVKIDIIRIFNSCDNEKCAEFIEYIQAHY
jgi:hypothetical protein